MDPNPDERKIRRGKNGREELKYLAVAFAALTVGIFIGRNSNPSQITLQMANTAGYYAQTIQTVQTQADMNRSMPEIIAQSSMETQNLNAVLVTTSLAQESMISETEAVAQTDTDTAAGTVIDTAQQTEITTAASENGSTTPAEAVAATEETTVPPETTAPATTTAATTTTAVPTTVPTTAATAKPTTVATKQGKVNINTANAAQLDTLPGIGEAKAQNIIDYRKANGPFRSIEDLINVSGIGEKTMDKLRPLITIGE